MFDIEKVVLEFLERVLDGRAVGVSHLGPPSHSGSHTVTQAVERNRFCELAHEFRPLRSWADQAHLADEYVPQLRELVEPGPPHEPADRRDPLVVGSGPDGPRGRLGVLTHRAKLVNREHAPVLADTRLVIKHGPA